MESAKIPILHHQHHHHRRHEQVVLPHQDQILGGSSSASTNSSTLDQYYSPSYAHSSWTSNPNAILNPGRLEYDDHVLNQDNQLRFNWPINANVNSFDHHQMQMSRSVISNSCPNLSEMISSSPSSSSIEVLDDQHNDNVKLFLSTLSSGNNNSQRFQSEDQFMYSPGSSSSSTPAKRTTFSQIYPTINLSNLSHHHQDFLSSANNNLGGDFHQHSSFQGQLGYDDYMKQSIPRPIELPAANMSEEKGCNNKANSEPKAAAGKRSRVESPSPRPSCQPFKVRKEKLGDRIAALQQMVAPFGKTDTASVLMEAIGYIKFLQNQVETLSVPYLKSTRNKPSRVTHGGGDHENDQERRRDLRSRGLCLVPMSCLSYMTDSGGAVWPPPPSYGGAT